MEGSIRLGNWIRTLALLLAAAVAAPAFAQLKPVDIDQISQVPAQVFDDGSGLPDLTVTAVSAAPDGYVWVGTMRGLARFEGQRMTPVPGPNAAFHAPVQDVLALPNGDVWVVMQQGGMYRWDGQHWLVIDAKAGLPETRVLRLRWFMEGTAGRLFATGTGFVAEWDGTRWQRRALPPALANSDIFDLERIASHGQEVLWLATFGQGLWRCVNTVCLFVPVDGEGPRFNEISTLAVVNETDGSTTLWAGSYGGGLASLANGRWTRFHSDNSVLGSNYANQFQVLPGQRGAPQLWAGLRNGLARWRDGRWEMVKLHGRDSEGRVKAIGRGQDAQGNTQLWLGTDVGALRLRLRGSWRTVSRVGQQGDGVWATLLEQHRVDSERLWLGSDGEGLMRFEDGQWRQFGLSDGLPVATVRSLARVNEGQGASVLWAGTWNGHVARFDGERFREIPTPWEKDLREAVNKILPVAPGEVWVALRNDGVAHFLNGAWTYFDPQKEGNPLRVVDLLAVGDGEQRVLWATTRSRGLARLRGGTWTYFGTREGYPTDEYFGMTLLPDAGNRPVLWLGTDDRGLVRLDISNPDKPVEVTRPALPEAPDPYVYGVQRDGSGDLIVCTNHGAARWHPRPDGSFDTLNFNRSDGLPHDECNSGAMSTDAHGRVWIGTIGGAAVYMPRPSDYARQPAPLRLTRALSADRDRTAEFGASQVTLDDAAQTLEVHYALLNGEREALTRYRTRLSPIERTPTEWGEYDHRSFTGLPPGEYVLYVEAKDYTGVAAKPLALAFRIPLPWWRTLPAVIGFALALLMLGVWLIRRRESQSRRREQQLVDLVRQRTHELENRGVELRRMNEELTRLSYHDALTDLANRRMLLERLHGEWDLAQVRGAWVAFVLFDLDQFKAYNDQRGHLAGDEALREIGRRIEGELRKPEDTAGRYGGEEFGVVLPGLSLAQAVVVGERIRKAVEDAGLPHPSTPQGVVTISVGVAAMAPRAGLSAELLIAAADAALYRAKQTGKNRVEAADVGPTNVGAA